MHKKTLHHKFFSIRYTVTCRFVIETVRYGRRILSLMKRFGRLEVTDLLKICSQNNFSSNILKDLLTFL
jgi:hypothetical protein